MIKFNSQDDDSDDPIVVFVAMVIVITITGLLSGMLGLGLGMLVLEPVRAVGLGLAVASIGAFVGATSFVSYRNKTK